MFKILCLLRPWSSFAKNIFFPALFLRRLLVCGPLALLLTLASCADQQVRTEAMVTRPSGSSGKEARLRAPVGAYRAQSVSGDYAGYAGLEQFIEEMVDKHGFERDYLRGLFSQAQRKDWTLNYLAKSDQAVKQRKPGTGGWTRYRAKFLDDRRINEGVEFAQLHSATLQRATRQYGVPEEYILAILAVETRFGSIVGSHRVLDALTTLSFDYARRGEYFRTELDNFLLMCLTEGFDPAAPVGSFAGAMGLGQFMPSSFLKYAVDFNGDGRRDLWDPEDAIGSIANYFAGHGWKSGQPVVTPLIARRTVTLETGIKKQYTIADIVQAGLQPVRIENTEGPLNLLLLQHTQYDQYLIGHPAFYTITRYNHSVYYAMAVHELAQAIKRQL